MSNRTLLEINHDTAHKIAADPGPFLSALNELTRAGADDGALLVLGSYGVKWHDALTHPEAQGNKDLGEPAASGLEVTDVGINNLLRLLLDKRHIVINNNTMQAMRDAYAIGALQASAKHEAAPTSPQPIKGETELESASNGMGLR